MYEVTVHGDNLIVVLNSDKSSGSTISYWVSKLVVVLVYKLR